MTDSKRIAVLLSGRGSNFSSIHEAISRGEIPARIVSVISNRPDAAGAARARELGYPTFVIDHKSFASREQHEEAVRKTIDEQGAEIICLAGYMRRLTGAFVGAYPNRIINIHPSLLPAFPGVDAQKQAVEHGVKIAGCTVHFVSEDVDCGPIIVQRAIAVLPDDSGETLAQRLLPEEHRAYVEALKIVCSDAYRVEGRRVIVTPEGSL